VSRARFTPTAFNEPAVLRGYAALRCVVLRMLFWQKYKNGPTELTLSYPSNLSSFEFTS
jgi:hypothetical protein